MRGPDVIMRANERPQKNCMGRALIDRYMDIATNRNNWPRADSLKSPHKSSLFSRESI